MNFCPCFFATVTASEELPDELGWVALVCFCVAAVLGFGSLVIRLFSPLGRRVGRGFALGSFICGLYPLLFWAYIYHIDYVAVAMDGTEASGPLWKHLWVPSLPVLTGIWVWLSYKNRPQTS